MVRIIGNAVGWVANAAKLPSVGLCLNASKTESLLEGRKGVWGMPWLSETTKDVVSCEKLRGVANEH